MLRAKPIIGVVVIAVALVVALGRHLRGQQGRAEVVSTAAPVVDTVLVMRQAVSEGATSIGVVAAAQRAELSAKVMGRVAQVYVREGERVAKGQVLAQLEAADLTALVAQASASAGAAQTAAELQKVQSRAGVQQASEALKEAQAKLSAVREGSRTQEKAAAGATPEMVVGHILFASAVTVSVKDSVVIDSVTYEITGIESSTESALITTLATRV